MLVRSRRAAAFAIGAALVAFATACTNPTAPSATPRNAIRATSSADGVGLGGSTHAATTTADGVGLGGST